jgi:hypothetical protein
MNSLANCLLVAMPNERSREGSPMSDDFAISQLYRTPLKIAIYSPYRQDGWLLSGLLKEVTVWESTFFFTFEQLLAALQQFQYDAVITHIHTGEFGKRDNPREWSRPKSLRSIVLGSCVLIVMFSDPLPSGETFEGLCHVDAAPFDAALRIPSRLDAWEGVFIPEIAQAILRKR